MEKKKYYVVTVGRAVGVFDNWLKVASLVSGISGALHQSFPTKEQATRVFNEEQANGNTRVVPGPDSPYVRSPAATPATTVNSLPLTPPGTPARWNTSSHRSSPRTPSGPPSNPRSRHASSQRATPTRAQSRSPPIFYNNVSYSRGSSTTPRSSPRDTRRMTPRVVVETPIDLDSYPSDNESNTSESSYRDFSPSSRYSSGRHAQISSSRNRTPFSPSVESPERQSPRVVHRVRVETPPALREYSTDEEGALGHYASYSKSVRASSRMSPISSPRLRTTKDVHVNSSSTPSSKRSTPRTRKFNSDSDSNKYSPVLPPGIPPVNVYIICQNAHNNHCHKCDEKPIQYAASYASQFGLSHPLHTSAIHAIPEIDPRSPLSRSGSALFLRPSPQVSVEKQMSNMFL